MIWTPIPWFYVPCKLKWRIIVEKIKCILHELYHFITSILLRIPVHSANFSQLKVVARIHPKNPNKIQWQCLSGAFVEVDELGVPFWKINTMSKIDSPTAYRAGYYRWRRINKK